MPKLVENPLGRKFFQQIQRQDIANQFFRARADVKLVALFKTGRPESAGWVFHKAQGMQDADDLVLNVAAAAKKIFKFAGRVAVQAHGQGIDRKIAPEKIHLDRGKLHSRQGSGIFVIFEPGCGHVNMTFTAFVIMVDDN